MIVAPRGVVNLAAGWMTLRAARRLRRADPGHAAQRRAFAFLTGRMAATEFGRAAGLEAGMRYDTFNRRVAPRAYEDFVPLVDRMKRGESDVMWPGLCRYFVLTAGTATGQSKCLPATDALVGHFQKAALAALLTHTARVGHTRVLSGRHLFLGGSTVLTPVEGSHPPVATAGEIGGIVACQMPAWFERHFYEPGAEIARMDDWAAKLQAIAERTRSLDITLLEGLPSWTLMLADAVRTQGPRGRTATPFLKLLWPHLDCFVHSGVPIGPFQSDLRAALGAEVSFHEIYRAAEGFIAAQDVEAARGLRLLTGGGLFFEFLPMAAFDEHNLANLGSKVIPLEEVQTGVDYALLLTTPAGLCRYLIGDVVRFMSTEVPRLVYVGRTNLRLNAFGEQVTEKAATEALLAVCQRHGWTVVNFHVAPVFADTLTGQRRGGHEWWIELKAPTVETPTANVISPELDTGLMQRGDEYAARRRSRGLEAPAVRLVMPGVFEQWMRKNGRWGGESKMPRCRSDRLVADQLADLSRFYIETPPPYVIRRT